MGQIISGLLMLFEQPFKLGDWIETLATQGPGCRGELAFGLSRDGFWSSDNAELCARRRVDLQTQSAARQARDEFGEVRRQRFAGSGVRDVDSGGVPAAAMRSRPDAVRGIRAPRSIRPIFRCGTPGDDAMAKANSRGGSICASCRSGLHLDEAVDDFSSPEVTAAVAEVAAPTLRLNGDDELALSAHAVMFRWWRQELIQKRVTCLRK